MAKNFRELEEKMSPDNLARAKAQAEDMMSDPLDKWLELHEAKWGKPFSKEKWFSNIVEECAELIQAIQHYRRKRVPFSAVRTEMADVMICIDMLLTIVDQDGPSIADDIERIAKFQVDILDGKTPSVHNDGEDDPPLELEDS